MKLIKLDLAPDFKVTPECEPLKLKGREIQGYYEKKHAGLPVRYFERVEYPMKVVVWYELVED